MIFLDLGTSNYPQMKDDLIALTTVRVGIAQLANIKIARVLFAFEQGMISF